MNNPFDYTPDGACRDVFRRLCAHIESLRKSSRPEDAAFCRELDSGKMLGVLIAEDDAGTRHELFAFSGQLGNGGFYHEGFVPPAFDYLQPEGFFKTGEADISRQNREISQFESITLAAIRSDYEAAVSQANSEIEEYREKCRLSKLERDARRAAGIADSAAQQALIRQSQFEKAELHRLKKKVEADLQPILTKLRNAESQLKEMKERRRRDSEALQTRLFSNFSLLNAKGERRNLNEIFSETSTKIPPSGAGECCAPKLLQEAYRQGWKPVSIAEFWYGNPKRGEVRIHGRHYPACRGKCLPVLSWMLQGLTTEPPLGGEFQFEDVAEPKILFENEWFCVVDKPAGMLSVPGKGAVVSLQQWLQQRYGQERDVKVAHRLDQDTSGLIVATFGPVAYKVMQKLFATRLAKKSYIADLEGDYRLKGLERTGRIELPLSPDFLDRPRQRVDFTDGRPAVTEYEFLDSSEGLSRVCFHPLTGRTHQLRMHAASASGLGMPIVGDRLYGHRADRLHLHARSLEFTFPPDGRHYVFDSPIPFSLLSD